MINIGMHDLDDNADHWDLKGTKARKKEAQRKKRHQHGKGRRETPAAEEAEEPHDYGEGGDDGSSDADDDSSHEGAEEDKPPLVEEPVADGAIVVGVLGEPNVGKSSIINALLGAHKVRLWLLNVGSNGG